MLTATFLAIFFVPLFFVTVRKIGERWAPVKKRVELSGEPPERARREYAGTLVDGEH
jgi:HAE1 family hydrophobic/amphiphilic exporter-1/multidrug efflux pump